MKKLGIMALLFLLTLMGAGDALVHNPLTTSGAGWLTNANAADDTCISDLKKKREEAGENSSDGLITQIIDYIKEVVNDTSEVLFTGIISNSGFLDAVNAAFALSIAFFGAAFMFGIVPLTFSQALIRGLKIAFIMAIISGGGWTFFSDYAVKFFNDGTDEIIDAVIGIATGDTSQSVSASGQPQPFKKLEEVAGDALSPEMMISAMTAMTTGPMALAMGGMMGVGIMAFIQMLVRAVRVYVISLVAKALLFGLAPIFISFMLFERTKNIFQGWINQLVNYSLQPILLFAFLSFFVVLIESTVENILEVDVCWTAVQFTEGSTTQNMFWRFVDENGKPSDNFTWEGLASCIKSGGECLSFPISPLDILTFLILSHLAYRFSDVVVHIATEISSSTLALDKLRSGLGEMIESAQRKQLGNNAP